MVCVQKTQQEEEVVHLLTVRPLVAASAALVALAATLITAAPTHAVDISIQHEGEPKVAVALGDSFTSGEGGRWKGNSQVDSGSRGYTDRAYTSSGYVISNVYDADSYANDCHRSLTAPITYAKNAQSSIEKVINLACSGARSKNLWSYEAGGVQFRDPQTQIDRLKTVANYHDVELIAIGAGGNDMGFGAAIGHCVKAWGITYATPVDAECWDEILGQVEPNLPMVGYHMEKTIKQVREIMSERGHPASGYRIVVMGYPKILPDEDKWRHGTSARWTYRCPFLGSDAQYLNDYLVPQLNGELEAAAEHMGVGYIDMTEAFAGHRLCEVGTRRSGESGTAQYVASLDMEWVRSVDVEVNASDLAELAADGFGELWPMSYTSFKQFDSIPAITDQGHVSESLHPNFYGQMAIGTCLKHWYAGSATNPTRKVKCTNGPSRDANDMVIATLPVTTYYKNTTDVAIPDTGNPGGGPTNWLDSTITVPTQTGGVGSEPGKTMAIWLDIDHARKGHLKIVLSGPGGNGYELLRDYAPADTGGWYDRYYYLPGHLNYSGTYQLRIMDNTTGYAGTLREWGIRFF
jgi:subtilisin-like proprotein convertase family protein